MGTMELFAWKTSDWKLRGKGTIIKEPGLWSFFRHAARMTSIPHLRVQRKADLFEERLIEGNMFTICPLF
jgi:hypothetical protein